MASPTIFWFRNDLRLLDNPALQYAITCDHPLIFIYIHDDTGIGWAPGAASRWWLHHSLLALQKELGSYKARLILLKGAPLELVPKIAKQYKANQVVCSRIYEPAIIEQDLELKKGFAHTDIDLKIFQGNLLFKPGAILNKQNNIYKVFTPFYKACLAKGVPSEIIDKPERIMVYDSKAPSLKLEQLHLLPKIKWDQGLKANWNPGERGAYNLLQTFLEDKLPDYPTKRDFPAIEATSKLSPHLHFGEISPQRIMYHLSRQKDEYPQISEQVDSVIRQLLWREFASHILISFPHTTNEPFQEKFKHFRWRRSDKQLETAWKCGKTGYPIIDAGMRELWHTGTMHNRVRMIVASFLTKNGLIHWKKGAEWFWDTLVDADLAQNSMNWQWVAGCGVDAAPYFRIFNPVTQSKKFDANGLYIRRWCPELNKLPDKHIHSPWTASGEILQKANIKLGPDYPKPILDLAETRDRALALYKNL